MAYMSQDNKKMLAPQIKTVLKKYGMKGSISVKHLSSLVVTLKEGQLDIIGNRITEGRNDWASKARATSTDVNPYWLDTTYTGDVLNFLKELKDAMNGKGSTGEQNFDESDLQADYHFVGWYINIHVGQWDKPYIVNKAA